MTVQMMPKKKEKKETNDYSFQQKSQDVMQGSSHATLHTTFLFTKYILKEYKNFIFTTVEAITTVGTRLGQRLRLMLTCTEQYYSTMPKYHHTKNQPEMTQIYLPQTQKLLFNSQDPLRIHLDGEFTQTERISCT